MSFFFQLTPFSLLSVDVAKRSLVETETKHLQIQSLLIGKYQNWFDFDRCFMKAPERKAEQVYIRLSWFEYDYHSTL